MSDEELKKNDESMSFLLGVLEDYSNRYIGYGGLFAASTFGIYALMSINGYLIPKHIYWLTFCILFFAGLISLIFTFRYVKLTHGITQYVRDNYSNCDTVFEKVIKKYDIQILRFLTRYMYMIRPMPLIILIIMYILVTFLPFYYMRF